MKSANSSTISSSESIVLQMLDWWIHKNTERLKFCIDATDPLDCRGVSMFYIGRGVLLQWPEFFDSFIREVQQDEYAAYLWGRLDSGHSDDERVAERTYIENELVERVGLLAKKVGWTEKHRQAITCHRVKMNKIRTVQDT